MAMKKFLFSLIVFLSLAAIAQAQTKAGGNMALTIAPGLNCQASQEEMKGIMKAVGYYLKAGEEGSSKVAENGFAMWATMSWNENGALKTVPIQILYDYFDEKKRPVSGEISACEVAGTVATVRLESDFDGARFTDMFTLVKDGQDWKIVSKVYHVKN